MARGLGTVVEPVLEDGGAILEFAVRDEGPFLRWALTLGDRLEVLSPVPVREALAGLRWRVAALYGAAARARHTQHVVLEHAGIGGTALPVRHPPGGPCLT